MKKAGLIVVLILLSLSLFACSGTSYKDGVYTAESAEFASSGWKDVMEITIEGGELIKINWDAVYKDDTIPIRKKQYSKSGLYGMMAAGSISEWYDQAILTEQYVLENGYTEPFVLDEGGHTDAIAGCTIHVDEFEALLVKCLEKAKK